MAAVAAATTSRCCYRPRALSPGARCEGRVLVALWACVERQCKTDPGLRDHPECQKLRR